MYSTHQKGEIGRLKVSLRATELGYIVSLPTTESRYDVIVDDGSKLHRVQVKYADWVGGGASGSVIVKMQTECRNNGVKKTYGAAEIDAVIAYLPKTDKCYWIPVAQFTGKKFISLRLEPSKNGQIKRVKFAKDFEW